LGILAAEYRRDKKNEGLALDDKGLEMRH